jgi:DNA-binding CsgD family transcriptional regulator
MKDKQSKGRQSRGSNHGMALLDESQVKEIVVLIRESRLSYRQIGLRYGVSLEVVFRIRNGESWTHITGGKVFHRPRCAVKLESEDVSEIKRLLSQGLPQRAIADRFNVSDKTITNIKLGRQWKWVQ